MIATEKAEKYQKDDESAGFEESNPEQTLVQHDAPPPGE